MRYKYKSESLVCFLFCYQCYYFTKNKKSDLEIAFTIVKTGWNFKNKNKNFAHKELVLLIYTKRKEGLIYLNNWEKVEVFCKVLGLILMLVGFWLYGRTLNFADGEYFVLAGILVQLVGMPAYYHNKKNKRSK